MGGSDGSAAGSGGSAAGSDGSAAGSGGSFADKFCDTTGAQIVSGLFTLSGRYAVEGFPEPCDVDGDGNLDLVITTSNSLIVRRGRGDGTFVAAPVVTAISPPINASLYLADFDGDGRCDVYYQQALWLTTPTSALAHGQVDATFKVTSPLYPSRQAPNDANESVPLQGIADLAGGKRSAIFVTWTSGFGGPGAPLHVASCKNDDSGCTFSDSAAFVGPKGNVYGGAVRDVDGDGKADVLASYFSQYSAAASPPAVVLMKGDGTGSFASGTDLAGLAGRVPKLVYDLDKDGFPDVGTTSISGDDYRVFWGDANQSFSASAPLLMSAPADFDGDGNLDLYVNGTKSCISFGAGARAFGKRMLVLPSGISSVDFNKDGAADVWITQAGVASIYLSTAKTTPPGPPDIQCGGVPAATCTGPSGF